MKITNVRQLKHETSTVLGWVEAGETVQVKRRQQVVAVLSPPRPAKRAKAVRPDFLAEVREIFGRRVMSVTGTEIVKAAREDR